MPLRAKIHSGALDKMAPLPQELREQPGDTPNDVLFGSTYGVRTIELNRPKKLNALDGSMCRKILPRLLEWRKSQLANVIIMAGAGPKAFCAGGDVGALAQDIKENGDEGRRRAKDYFGLEYQLDQLIATLDKPYIAYMDGITMGGGVGLGVHAPFRIATERTKFGMPETRIGFFPDVGASFFLSRMDGSLGMYLAMTSETLDGVQAYYAGAATHYLDSNSLGSLTGRLSELVFKDYATMEERAQIIDDTIEEFNTGLPPNEDIKLGGDIRAAIDRCFSKSSVEEIVRSLEHEAQHTGSGSGEGGRESVADWAQRTLKQVSEKSPTSLKVTLAQLRAGKEWDINTAFRREYEIAATFMEHPDFVEGVSARLASKPARTPAWKPAKLEDVSATDVETFFLVEEKNKLPLFNEATYMDYPLAAMGMPRESEVMDTINRSSFKSGEEAVRSIVASKRGKVGVEEKVTEIVLRKTVIDGNGVLIWVQ